MSKTTKAEFLAAWKSLDKASRASATNSSYTAVIEEIRRAKSYFDFVSQMYAAALAEEDEGEKLNKQESHDTQTIR